LSLGFLGHGVGLRVPHYEQALREGLDVDWIEIITENFFGGGGRPRAVLQKLRGDLPLVFHGVSMGIGSLSGPSDEYLKTLAGLVNEFEPAWVSDHLCWTSFEGRFSHDLLPLPYTEEALLHVVGQIGRVQDRLRRPIVLENVSSYVAFAHSAMPEWQFLSEVARRSGAAILLDVNNVLVNAANHGCSPAEYLAGLEPGQVQQLHLANHSERGAYRFDDHKGAVPEAVWQLFDDALLRFGPLSSLVEWDEDVPAWEVLRAEQRKASARARAVLERRTPSQTPAFELSRSEPTPRETRPTPSLQTAQALFWSAVTWPDGVRGYLERAGPERREAFDAMFASSAAFDRVERVDVYADGYFYRLLEALREMFPRLACLLDGAAFHNLVTDYLLARPSREPNLRNLGDRLPAYLERHPLAGGKRGIQNSPCVDLARLEQALDRALDCPEGERISEAALLALAPELWPELRVCLARPCSIIESSWDLPRLVALCDRGEREAALALEPLSEPQHLLVGRRGHRVYFRTLAAGEALALGAFQSGANFGRVCAELSASQSSFQPSQMVQYLRAWLAEGAVGARSSEAPPRAVDPV
jgi:uncharacterized protein (UPF0276 family)